MKSRNRAAGDGRKEHRHDRKPRRIGDLVPERGEFGNRIFPAEKQYRKDSQRHEKQRTAENRIDASDNLIDGQQGRHDIINENDAQNDQQQPREIAEDDSRKRRSVDAVGDQRSGLREEHRAHEHHQSDRKDAHQLFDAVAQIGADRLRKARAVIAQGDHAGDKVMGRAHENPAERNPEKRHGTVGRAQHGAENRPQTGDIEQLDEESLPHRHRNIVHAVERHGRRHGTPCIGPAKTLQITSVCKIRRHQQRKAHQKSDHYRVSFARI